MIPVTILFFGPARDLAGVDTATVELAEGATLSDLRTEIERRYPRFEHAMATIRFAVNESFASDTTTLSANDEVALIPPVSGGTEREPIWAAFTGDEISAADVRAFIMGDPASGGIVTFEGATRSERDADHGRLTHLEYEAYENMALKQLERIAKDAFDRWSLGRVAIVHRLGRVLPAEVSVMIAVAAGHRAESFEACRFLIDTLKADVPIWKRDVFEDGFVRWVDPTGSKATEAHTT